MLAVLVLLSVLLLMDLWLELRVRQMLRLLVVMLRLGWLRVEVVLQLVLLRLML